MSVKVVKFGSLNCGPCKQLDPILSELKEEMTDVEFVSYDVDTPDGAVEAGKLGVMGIPRVLIYKDNEIVEDMVGFKPKGLLIELIENHQ